MALVLTYSDTHLREQGSFPPFNTIQANGLTGELNNMIRGYHFVAAMIREHRPAYVACLGDTFHVTEYQSAKVLHGADAALGSVKEACDAVGAEHDIVAGNHEIENDLLRVTCITPLRGYGRIILTYELREVAGIRVAVIPHFSDTGHLYQCLVRAQEEADLILAHADFEGVVYESGQRSKSMLSPRLLKPCLAGDIHLPQDVAAVSYCGSLVQHRFGRTDLDQVGGVLMYDTQTGKRSRVANHYSKHYVRTFDPLDARARFSPEHVALQVVTSLPAEEVEALLAGYDYYYVPRMASAGEEEESATVNRSLVAPADMLRDYVASARPSALELFDTVMKDQVSTRSGAHEPGVVAGAAAGAQGLTA
jgi:hypothetical protein